MTHESKPLLAREGMPLGHTFLHPLLFLLLVSVTPEGVGRGGPTLQTAPVVNASRLCCRLLSSRTVGFEAFIIRLRDSTRECTDLLRLCGRGALTAAPLQTAAISAESDQTTLANFLSFPKLATAAIAARPYRDTQNLRSAHASPPRQRTSVTE